MRNFFKLSILFIILFLVSGRVNAWGGKAIQYRPLELYDFRTVMKDENYTERYVNYNHGSAYMSVLKEGRMPSLFLEGDRMRVHWVRKDKGDSLVSVIINEPYSISQEGLMLFETDKATLVVSRPLVSKKYKTGLRDLIPSNTQININPKDNGFEIVFNVNAEYPEGAEISFWRIYSDEALFSKGYVLFKDVALLMRKDTHFIGPEGYYYKMPNGYWPYQDNRYYLNPSTYVALELGLDGNEFYQIALESLLWLIEGKINEEGYIPMPNLSLWLSDEYKINENYYDTRWNLDLSYHYLIAYNRNRFESDLISAKKIINHFIAHANKYNISVSGGDKEGIFVADYSGDDNSLLTHSSLNHQLMGLKALYMSYKIDKDEETLKVAERMMRAIEITTNNWIKEDGDLFYAIYPDLTYKLDDYPTLTYNDLLDVDRLYRDIYKENNIYLNTLIVSKEAWLKKNGHIK